MVHGSLATVSANMHHRRSERCAQSSRLAVFIIPAESRSHGAPRWFVLVLEVPKMRFGSSTGTRLGSSARSPARLVEASICSSTRPTAKSSECFAPGRDPLRMDRGADKTTLTSPTAPPYASESVAEADRRRRAPGNMNKREVVATAGQPLRRGDDAGNVQLLPQSG